MNYVMAILILLILIKVMELQKRISNMESHGTAPPHKSVLASYKKTTDYDGPRTWVIPNLSAKRLTPDLQ